MTSCGDLRWEAVQPVDRREGLITPQGPSDTGGRMCKPQRVPGDAEQSAGALVLSRKASDGSPTFLLPAS